MKAYEQTLTYLTTLNLKGVANRLDEMIHDAEISKTSYITFLNTLFTTEIAYRVKRRVESNMVGAHFPVVKRIDSFDFGRVKGIGKSEVVNLLDCRWLDNRENLLFFGPPGIGKTHLALALGAASVERGYKVCFERVTNLIRLLKTAEIQKTSYYRIRRITKSNLLIIDEIGYTPIEKREANLFFNLISETHERLSLIVTSNKSFDSWAEMMGDSVMTTALLDRLLHHARVFNLDGESYRIKNKGKEV
ncbi:MAG: Insertion sequence IS5376 putative ATP-binding protein [Syntrophomonadaceae bacterium]|nr:Insertion sequence IS5376 putative ATP-binding protein [Bacillota bacterium]